ncbi:MAG TPA: hypothetical protein VFX23_15525 [Limnobacter sp.]|nr:hypothetical protein [Limnobacter sp.]HEX5487397.1 hypothetical protein [Limnobacter sp.]
MFFDKRLQARFKIEGFQTIGGLDLQVDIRLNLSFLPTQNS